jgi:hypothetical protein
MPTSLLHVLVHGAWTCIMCMDKVDLKRSIEIDTQHRHVHAVWRRICSKWAWTCRMDNLDMDLQYGHRNAAWTCIMDMDMAHATWKWAYSVSMTLLHVHIYAACTFPSCMSMSMLHTHVHTACAMSMLHFNVHAAGFCPYFPCCMSMPKLHVHVQADVHAGSPRCLSMLPVRAACTRCMSILPVLVLVLIYAAYSCRMSMLHDHKDKHNIEDKHKTKMNVKIKLIWTRKRTWRMEFGHTECSCLCCISMLHI